MRDSFVTRSVVMAAAAAVTVSVLALPAWGQRRVTAGGGSVAPRQVTQRGPLLADEQHTINLFEKARASVVFITTQVRVRDRFRRSEFDVPRGTGSGFIWDNQGHVVTNRHVLSGASSARVRLSDGRDVSAELVGDSAAHDLAVLRVDVQNLPPPLPIGSSSDLKVGQSTFAIGNPFGLDWTLTTGIISALDRSLPSEDGRASIEHLIQTDAAINPGNSGGPLLDSAGRLIGVNTIILSPTGGFSGVGFAIPVDTVNRVVPQLIGSGRYVRPAIGVEVDDRLSVEVGQRLGTSGVAIYRVTPGSPAAAAGLRGIRETRDGFTPGDVIVAVNGQSVDTVARLTSRLDDYPVGDTVRLTVLRDGKRVDVPVRLEASTR